MSDKFGKLLKKADTKVLQETKPLATQIAAQFAKADKIMEGVSDQEHQPKPIKQKVVYVSYALPESYVEAVTQIRKNCMRNDIDINKSEIIKIGIDLVNKLTVEEIENLVDGVRLPRGRPKD